MIYLVKVELDAYNSPKQDERRPSEKDANVHPHIVRRQVAVTSIPTSLRLKPSTKKANVPTSQVPKSKNNISDQVPGGNRQVPAHDIRHVPYCLSSRPPHVHS